ncbi:hypothetical protein CCR94_03180 [Rhodoblastus sphagnicola]|uniref:Uncharacterized protein n=1 Tax=Rhodoblastus sphagnicola TaxID=333368 RepID=A0A2S6NEF8_9HYPH|nr:vWA domain-containing protein [Rhodoblastus sphagnicola]MBB4200163.1 mxaL protein [Rhodoblastus sphagnicola]PPQ32993.1 hypothetical protein CCR94_03180 [Rhodoblastus sphagnicola]
MTRANWRDPRLGLLILALALTLAALSGVQTVIRRAVYDVVIIVDITGSMNTRDATLAGRPASRLDFVKAVLRESLASLPCASRVALGVFSERRPFLLFEPVEICGNGAPVAGTLDALDWRMAWEGDSHVAAGLYRSIEMARDATADLMFFTDGQEAPPLPLSGPPAFDGRIGDVHGLIVGVGGYELSPIPKYDDSGREIGFQGVNDVPHENRSGGPPPDAEQREGYDPRNAPFGSRAMVGSEHLSSVREPYLKSLAETTGLRYVHLETADALSRAYRAAAHPRALDAALDLRPACAAIAALMLLALYILPPLLSRLSANRARRAERLRAPSPKPERKAA